MAILTRPLFHSQERIDLEDLVQLQSGLRTDSKLWVRQLYADKNFIVKGFDVTGLGTDAITVNLLDSTLLFAGRRDLTGIATIGVDAVAVIDDTVTISNSDGVNFTLTAVAVGGGNTAATFEIGTDAASLATNLGTALGLIANLSTSVLGTTITVSADRTGFTTITASNTSSFNSSGSIIGTFDYTSTAISSPADLSYFILQSSATGDETRLTSPISASNRAATNEDSRTLFIYGTLTTVQGTPITKAFWDPSANSGAGAEFNQRVNTAQDTSMELLISTSKLNQATDADATTFFENVPICEIEVDSSGIILSIRDVRPLLFEAEDNRPWNRSTPYATLGIGASTANTTVNLTVGSTTYTSQTGTFVDGEIVDFFPLMGTNPGFFTSARLVSATPTNGTQTQLTIEKPIETADGEFGLSSLPVFFRFAVGRTSGAGALLTSVSSNFFRDDKSLGDFRNSISALATEIRNVKGTERWYEDPPASVKDILRFINSTIVGLDPNARYSWLATNSTDPGTLTIALDPLSNVELTVSSLNNLAADDTIVFTDSRGDKTLTARTADPGAMATQSTALSFSTGTTTLNADVTYNATFTLDESAQVISATSGVISSGGTLAATLTAIVTGLNNATNNPTFASTYIASESSSSLVITALADGTAFNAAWVEVLDPTTTNLVLTQGGNLVGGVNGLGAENFLIGTDSEATASHITSSIGFNDGLSATFAESNDTPGNYIISIGRSTEAITVVAINVTTTGALVLNPVTGIFPAAANTDALANIRVYGFDNQFTFPASTLSISPNEVLFVTLPDFDASTVSDVTFNNSDNSGNQFIYSSQGPSTGQDWNTTNKAIFEDSNNVFKTVDIANFECNDRNYWIAYRDRAETIYIRDIGELGTGESANIGHGISNATLSYIGAPDENTSTPAYPQVDIINSFPPTNTEGAYLTADGANDFNNTLVAQSENLTSAINDLNDHLTSIKDTQYQNLGLKLIDGGFWTWNATTGNITSTATAMLQIPGLADNLNNIDIIGTGASFNPLADGDVLFVDVNRQDTRTNKVTPAGSLTVSKGNIDTGFTPTRDRIVFARRVGDFLFVGVGGTTKLSSGQSAPIDSSLQFLGLRDGQLPRQLNAHLQTTGTINARAVDVGNGDAVFPVGGLDTPGNTDDDEITLTIPASSPDGNTGVLFWEGATFDINGGNIFDESTTNAFRMRTSDVTFAAATTLLNAGNNPDGEVYYAISIDVSRSITATDSEIGVLDDRAMNAIPPITPVIGRLLGEPVVSVGIPATAKTGSTDRADIPSFGAGLPIALIRVTATGGAIDTFDADTLTVLGSAGSGGGGGSGDANQDLNNFINRLNLSTFEYMTPVIPGVSTSDNIDIVTAMATTATPSATGFPLLADTTVTTLNLIDREFNADSLTPIRTEIEAYWAEDSSTGLPQIDPNAKWSVSLLDGEAFTAFTPATLALSVPVVGFRNSSSVLVGQNLTNSSVNNTIFASKHGLSTGHKINITTTAGISALGPSTPVGDTTTPVVATQFYARVVSEDSFFLYNTVANADDLTGTTGLVSLSGTGGGSVTFNRDAGIIDRLGTGNVVRGTFDTRLRTLTGGAFVPGSAGSYRLRVVGDADSAIRDVDTAYTLSGFSLFYKFEGAAEGINPNSVTDINQLLADNHLGAGQPSPGLESTTSRAIAGRGVLLKDSGTGTPLREIAIIDGVLSVTDDTGAFVAIAARDAEGNLLVP